MPRDGSNNYTLPAGTTATPAAVITSASYNAFINDVAIEFNRMPVDSELTAAIATRVAETGDVMTGSLRLNYASPTVLVDKTASGQNAYFGGQLNGLMRWIVRVGDSTAESTGNLGSNFAVSRYDDAGAVIDSPFTLARSTGNANFLADMGVGGNHAVTGIITAAGTSHTFGSGSTGTNLAQIVLNGGSGIGGGPNVVYRRNGTNNWSVGSQSATSGGGTDDFQFYNWGLAAYAIRITAAASNVSLGSTTASSSTTTGALVIAGGAGIGGAIVMGGNLTINKVGPVINLDKTASGENAMLFGRVGTSNRWGLRLGDSTAEGGSNAGSEFSLNRYDDSGSVLPNAIVIRRSDARATFGGDVLLSSVTGVMGYTTGAGGSVSQITNRTTGVTLNRPAGEIRLVSAAGSATFASFTFTNSTIAASDVVAVCQKSGTDLYEIHVTAVAAGSCRITYRTTGGTTTETPIFNFAVIRGANA